MKFLTLLLGVLFILTLFNVGESFLKRLNVKKIYVLAFIALELLSLLLPTFQIAGVNFTVGGFILPTIASLAFLREIKNKRHFSRTLIAYLSVVLIMQLFFLTNGIYLQSEILSWTIIVSIVSIIALFICYYPKQAFISLFWGINTAEMIFNFTRNSSDLSSLILGSDIMLFALITSFLMMLFCYNISYVIRRRQKAKTFRTT